MTDCTPRWWGPGAHKFQPRYDEQRTAPQWLTNTMLDTTTKVDIQGNHQDWKKTYVHDICSRCGAVVQHPLAK